MPFLFTTTLITFMFAHMYRVKYFGEDCSDASIVAITSEDIWKSCGTVAQSYQKSIFMFLSGDWDFVNRPGLGLTYAFAFIIGVLLLNIVIAVVNNEFTDVQNAAENVFWDRRLSLMQEIDSMTSPFVQKKVHYPSERFSFCIALTNSAN